MFSFFSKSTIVQRTISNSLINEDLSLTVLRVKNVIRLIPQQVQMQAVTCRVLAQIVRFQDQVQTLQPLKMVKVDNTAC